MPERNQAKTAKPSWVTLALVLVVSGLFGLLVLPYLSPSGSSLSGEAAPEFVLPVLYGGEPGNRIRLSDQKGKVVVLDFWASWCVPCRAQSKVIDSIAKRFENKGVVVVGVSTSDKQDNALRFLEEHTPSYASVFDEDDRVARSYRVTKLPTIVVVDKLGQISAVREHMVSEAELEDLVEGVL